MYNKCIINDDTLLIVDYDKIYKTYRLSNNIEVDKQVVKKNIID